MTTINMSCIEAQYEETKPEFKFIIALLLGQHLREGLRVDLGVRG